MKGIQPLQEAPRISGKVNTNQFIPGQQSKTGMTKTERNSSK